MNARSQNIALSPTALNDIEDMELCLFVKAMNDHYGYDFSNYQLASLKRRVIHLVDSLRLNCISELLPKIFYEQGFLSTVISHLSVGVTELFRDPLSYVALQDKVFPFLKTYPHCRIWDAGCATGEEAYSLNILLKEQGLSEYTQIYATDFNEASIEAAKKGILTNLLSKEDTRNYQKAGGLASVSDYFTSSYGLSKIKKECLTNINFTQHNLVQDAVFCEAHLVVCRNVLIYFNLELQNKVLQLLADSLIRGGFLMLGPKESLMASPLEKSFKVIDYDAKIFQKL